MQNFMGFDGFTWFMGVVEDNNDPEKVGRVRVRCLGIHTEDKQTLPTSDLPWAMVMMPTTSASVSQIGHSPSGLLRGSWVMGFFRDGESAQEPVVMGTFHGYPTERPNTNLGFCDPTGTHPVEINEPDTSRVSRGLTTSKLYQTRRDGVNQGHRDDTSAADDETGRNRKSVANKPIAWSSKTWQASAVPFNARYPYNKTQQTESGHLIELDDTPDNERILIWHRKDTFVEMHPDGTIQIHAYNKGEILVDTEFNIECKGNINIYSHGNTSIYSDGNIDMESEGDVQIKCKNYKLTATESVTETAPKGNVTYTSGEITVSKVTHTKHTHTDPAGLAGAETSSPNG